jgi:thiol-disulfide isomerase/thioredoxin
VGDRVDRDRRLLVFGSAMAIGAAHAGLFRAAMLEGAPQGLSAIDRAGEWLNSSRLTAEALKGKAVVVQFCTYTCINWLRTLPYVRAWAEKYGPDVVIIGVHTPEFAFEHDLGNVRRALRDLNVTYPVVLDNDYAIWRAFENQYWPALYFVDGRGRVREQHFGEGEYERSERIIQRLRGEIGGAGPRGAEVVTAAGVGVEAAADWANLRSGENYLGYRRTEKFSSPGGIARERDHLYAAPPDLGLNQWALAGHWKVGPQAAVTQAPGGRLTCRFHARDLHLVMGPAKPGTQVRFRVSIDGHAPGSSRGGDIDASGAGTVVEQRLYQLIRQPAPVVARRFELEFLDAGVELFALTFG